MPTLILIMTGGAVGAALRHLVAGAMPGGWPWGTLVVNVLGGLAMGVLAGVVARGAVGEPWRLLLGVGVLGGFTTFSAFSLETWTLLEQGQIAAAAGYVAIAVVASVVAVGIGLTLMRTLA